MLDPAHRRIYLLAGGIALALLLGFALSAPHLRDAQLKEQLQASTTPPLVYFHDSYKKGVHTITGQVAVADACVSASASAALIGSSTIALSLDIPPDTGTCLALPATTTFMVSLAAPAGSLITASINGNDATTTRY